MTDGLRKHQIDGALPADPAHDPHTGSVARGALTLLLFVALPIVILAGAWRLGGVSALEDDLIYYLPVRQYIGQCLRAGHLPFWNPLVAMGSPIAADPQAGLWYPPTWLFAVLPVLWAYPVTLVLHFAIAGAGMYRFLRAGRHPWAAALLGGLAFEFAGFLVAHRAHLTMLEAVAWLPWLFYAWRRFADTRLYRYFVLAVAVLGMQMLVQHIQITIIGLTLLTAWVIVVPWWQRPGLAWQYPLGVVLGVMLSGIQLIPTLFYFSGSIRGTPAYHLFVENSWWPGSAVLLLFPMFFGARTPTSWEQPWWGMSHFCEQSAYASLVILVLAIASLALVRRRPTESPSYWDREIIFWWVAVAGASLIALGQYGPLAETLFQVPLYRSLRVPARWILVWSFALPVLASATTAAVLAGGDEARRIVRSVRWSACIVLPAIVALTVAVLILARWRIDDLVARYSSDWFAPFWSGLRWAVRPDNPALWLPIGLTVLTAVVVVRWSRRPVSWRTATLVILMTADLAVVAGRVDIAADVYTRTDLVRTPALAEAIRDLDPGPGDRLLVPRFSASYDRPLEVLWPQSNLRLGVSTFNSYGPLWPAAHRLLFHFMPWGSSETVLSLVSQPALCRAMGIRFLAARSEEEHQIAGTAAWLRTEGRLDPIVETTGMRAVRAGADLLWRIRIDRPGLYQLCFDAEPGRDIARRSFVRLEDTSGKGVSGTISIEPADLAVGRRRLRLTFRCDSALGEARARVKSERGWSMSAGLAEFGCIAAAPPEVDGTAPTAVREPFGSVRPVEGGITLYALTGSLPLVRWAAQAVPAPDPASAVDLLLNHPDRVGLPAGVVVEWPPGSEPPGGGEGAITVARPTGDEVRIRVDSSRPGVLVFNEAYDPGWRARIDGRPVPVRRVNAVVQSVVVPAGGHAVDFVYVPPGLRMGCVWSAGGLLALILGAWATRRLAPT